MKRLILSLLVATVLLPGANAARADVVFIATFERTPTYGNAGMGISFGFYSPLDYEATLGAPMRIGGTGPSSFTYGTPGAQPVTFDDEFTLRSHVQEFGVLPPKEIGFELKGRLSGTLSEGSSTVRLTFPDQRLVRTMDGYDFSARALSIDIPPPGGRFDVPVEMTVTVAQAPEPSALALGLSAAPGLAARRWLRRRRARPDLG